MDEKHERHDRPIMFNDKLRAADAEPQPFLFQDVHTIAYRCRRMQSHIEVLDSASRRLFGLRLRLSAGEAERRAARLLETCRLSRNASVRLTMKLYPSGDVAMECDAPSIYAGYVLRSLRPEAVCIAAPPPMPSLPTSAAAQTRELADAMARARGFHTAILTDAAGGIVSECTQPILIVRGYTLLTPPSVVDSVEMQTAAKAARAAGLKLLRRPLACDDLKTADEVLFVSWQGVTSVSHIENKPYMSIIAEKLARQMELQAR